MAKNTILSRLLKRKPKQADQQVKKAEKNHNLFKNCRELPYHNFNEVQVEGDFTYLIKSGTCDDTTLKRHWIEILDEYFRISNDFSQLKFFKDRAHLKYLETKLEILECLIYIDEESLNDDQLKEYNAILKKYRVSDISVSILGCRDDIELKINQFKKVNETEKNTKFEEELAAMRMNGYNVNRYDITVSEMVALRKMMNSVKGSKGKTSKHA